MILIGVLLMLPVVPNIVVIVRSHLRLRDWTKVQASVTKVREQPDRSGRQEGSTIVVNYKFTDSHGMTRSGVDHRMYRKPRKGSTLEVVYDPGSPDISESASIGWLYGWLILTGGAFAAGILIVVSAANGTL